METGSDQLPAVSIELQVIEARPAGDQLGGRAGHRPLERAVVVGGAVFGPRLLAQGPGPLLSSRPEPLPQPVDRLHQDLGIAVGAQLAGDVPVVIVLAAPGVVADRIATSRRAERIFFMSLRASWIASAGSFPASPWSCSTASSTWACSTRLIPGPTGSPSSSR